MYFRVSSPWGLHFTNNWRKSQRRDGFGVESWWKRESMKNTVREGAGQAIGQGTGKPFSAPRSHGSPSPAVAAGIVVAMLIIPAFLALLSVRIPAILEVSPDASPHGYTWSLLLFLVPILVISMWFLRIERLEIPQPSGARSAFWRLSAVYST